MYRFILILILVVVVPMSSFSNDWTEEEFKDFLAKAEVGDAVDQINVALLYSRGYGVEQNHVKAFEWYRKAAAHEQPRLNALAALSRAYAEGKGVSQDYITAYMWADLLDLASRKQIDWDGNRYTDTPGIEESKELRNELARKMTEDEISKAKILSVECYDKKYKNCWGD